MPPTDQEGTIIILDVGRNVAETEDQGENFFQKEKECASRIIERKILSQDHNLVGVVLLGSKKTENNLAEECNGAFKHIVLHTELMIPTWLMIRSLPESPSKSRGDWIESLAVAADHFKNNSKITSKKIILMTNFRVPLHSFIDADVVVNGLKNDNFEVHIIGPDIYDESRTCEKNIMLARQLVEQTDGATATFEHAMNYLLFNKKKSVKPTAWNVNLNIGPNIKIPVSAYIRLKDDPVVKNWQKAVRDPITSTASTSEGIVKSKIHVNTDNQEIISSEKVIKGYVYGQQIIPFADCDKSLLYKSGEKCLSVYGFTHSSNIKWHNLNGDGLHYVFGKKGDEKAQNAIKCLVECLHELDLVGVVRRVYNKDNAPKMFALMPVIDSNNYFCLSMAGICFKDDIKNMAFPSVNYKKYQCTSDQVDTFKDLIKAMDLTKAYDDTYDDTEAFPVANTVSPTAQYILDCIAYRALNPGKPLPPPRDEIMSLFKVPSIVEKRSREPLEALKKLFVLNKVEIKKRGKKRVHEQNDINDINLDHKKIDHVMPQVHLPDSKNLKDYDKIGTTDPANDFKILLSKGRSITDLSTEMTEAIESLIYFCLDGNYSKAIEAMTVFRAECVKTDPSCYNDWFKKFKIDLVQRKKSNVIDIINEKNINLISKDENASSSVNSDHNDTQLYECDTVPDSIEFSINSEVNNMFDEM